jgi:cell division protein FtsI (penicillin-binding protein 3)
MIILGRLFWLQVLCHRQYADYAAAQQERRVTIKAVRGDVVDRDGRVLLHTLISRTLVANPAEIADRKRAARDLAPILGCPEAEIRRRLARRAALVELDPQVTESEATRIRALKLKGIRLVEAGRRVKLVEGCDLLGALDHDGYGNEGIERSMDEFLAGVDGWETRYVDARGRLAARPDAPAKPAAHGARVVLTIDSRLQWVTEDALARVMSEHRARGGSAVLVQVETGEVLALASIGATAPGPGRKVHRLGAIEDTYEPGSTFKLVTFAAALELDLIDDDAVFFAENGRADFGGFEIRDVKKLGWLCAPDVIALSSNIATAKIGLELGARELYQAARRLGFGRRTEIELPGEAPGMIRPVEEWSGRSVATVAIGHELAATTLQLAMAYGAVAQGGELRRPRIVREVIAADGAVRYRSEPEVVRRTMSEETAATLTRYLVRAVELGTGKRAAIPGVPVAGKTGTAQKARTDGRGYAQGKFVSSFVGFFPADSPRFVLAVAIDEPAGMHYGGDVAAPAFREVAIATLGPANLPDGLRPVESAPPTHPGERVVVPDVRLLTAEAAIGRLSAAGLGARVTNEGERILTQDPVPGSRVAPRTLVTLGRSPLAGVAVPELRGLALRDALRQLRGAGIEVRVSGVGKVHRQEPPAGTKIERGAICRLLLAPDRSPAATVAGVPTTRTAAPIPVALAEAMANR